MTTDALKGRDLLRLSDFSPAELALVLDTATEQKRAWASGRRDRPLEGQAIALIFQKPSMRTRVSFEVACTRLGATPIVLGGNDTVFSRGETVYDTTKVLERYCDAIVIRTFDQSLVAEIADTARVPVVNALTDDYHPCQGLADLLTIREHKGDLAGLNFAYVGDGNNMASTYLEAGALAGMQVRIATPKGFEPAAEAVETAREIAERTGATIDIGIDAARAVTGADVVAADTWASMGQESERDERIRVFEPYCVDASLMGLARSGAVFMHCLPAHRGEEVTDAVIDSEASIVFDEAENRLHAQKALLSLLLG